MTIAADRVDSLSPAQPDQGYPFECPKPRERDVPPDPFVARERLALWLRQNNPRLQRLNRGRQEYPQAECHLPLSPESHAGTHELGLSPREPEPRSRYGSTRSHASPHSAASLVPLRFFLPPSAFASTGARNLPV